MKGDPTLASSLGGSRGVPPLHYEQPGSPGSQVTLYGTGAGSYSYTKPNTASEYWSAAGTPSPPAFDCVPSYQNVAAISVGDAANIQLYSGGAYSVSTGSTTAPSPWPNLPLTNEDGFDGTIMTADPKECFGCGNPTSSWKRDETGRFYCHSCIYKMNGINRSSMRCGKPKQTVATVNFSQLFVRLPLSPDLASSPSSSPSPSPSPSSSSFSSSSSSSSPFSSSSSSFSSSSSSSLFVRWQASSAKKRIGVICYREQTIAPRLTPVVVYSSFYVSNVPIFAFSRPREYSTAPSFLVTCFLVLGRCTKDGGSVRQLQDQQHDLVAAEQQRRAGVQRLRPLLQATQRKCSNGGRASARSITFYKDFVDRCSFSPPPCIASHRLRNATTIPRPPTNSRVSQLEPILSLCLYNCRDPSPRITFEAKARL